MRLQLSFILLLGFLFLSVSSTKAQTEISGDSITSFAHKYIDTPYRRSGSSPKAFDCSGFSSFVYRHFGYELNRSSRDQVKDGVEVNKNSLQPGDLVLFKGRNSKANRIGHVGIVVEADDTGRFKFIHASTSQGVTINDGDEDYYRLRFMAARRILKNDAKNIFENKDSVPIFPLPAAPIQLSVPAIPFSLYLPKLIL